MAAAQDQGFADQVLSWAGGYLLAFVGLVHLLEVDEHFDYATYLGFSFLAVFAASSIAAAGVAWGGRRWAWILGALICGVTLAGFVVSRMFGLPGYPGFLGDWYDFPGWVAVALELSFLATAPLALTSRGRTLVGVEQRRIERERVPPDRQETPEHFALIEQDMFGIRNRMAPDLSDLRTHVDPRVLKERVKQRVRMQLRALLHRNDRSRDREPIADRKSTR